EWTSASHIFPTQGAFSANGQTSGRQITRVFRWFQAKDMYSRAGKADPKWVEDDEDIYDPRRSGGFSAYAIATVTTAGGDAPDAVRIAFVFAVDGKEHVVRAEPPGTDPEPLIEQILAGMKMAVLAVRVYPGEELIDPHC